MLSTYMVEEPLVGRNASIDSVVEIATGTAFKSNWMFDTVSVADVFSTSRLSVKESPACTFSGSVVNPVTIIRGVDVLVSSPLSMSLPFSDAP